MPMVLVHRLCYFCKVNSTELRKQKYVKYIKDRLSKDDITYTECYKDFSSKFNVKTEITFIKYWKIAKEKHKQQLAKLETKQAERYVSKELEAFEQGLNDKHKHALALRDSIIDMEEMLKDKSISARDKISIRAEIRNTYKLLGDWYGLDAAKNSNLNVIRTNLEDLNITFE